MPTSRAPKNPELGPTPERLRRSRFERGPAVATDDARAVAGRFVFRSRAVIDRLLFTGVIEPRQHQAATRFRADYEIGILGVRQAASGSSSTAGNHYPDVQLDAVTRYRRAVAALGPTDSVVMAVVFDEYSIARYAQLIGGRRQEIAGILKLGLTRLADHYGLDS